MVSVQAACDAISKWWFPLATLLRQGGNAVAEAVAKLQGKKMQPCFEDFVCVQGLQPLEVIKVVALMSSDAFTVAAMCKVNR